MLSTYGCFDQMILIVLLEQKQELDLRVARMTTENGGPVSCRRRKKSMLNKYFRAECIDTQIKYIVFSELLPSKRLQNAGPLYNTIS